MYRCWSINEQVGSLFLAGAAKSHTPISAIYHHGGRINYNGMGKHISDTRTLLWEIYYVHPQCGRTLFADRLRQAAAAKIREEINIHRPTYTCRDRTILRTKAICLAALANYYYNREFM